MATESSSSFKKRYKLGDILMQFANEPTQSIQFKFDSQRRCLDCIIGALSELDEKKVILRLFCGKDTYTALSSATLSLDGKIKIGSQLETVYDYDVCEIEDFRGRYYRLIRRVVRDYSIGQLLLEDEYFSYLKTISQSIKDDIRILVENIRRAGDGRIEPRLT